MKLHVTPPENSHESPSRHWRNLILDKQLERTNGLKGDKLVELKKRIDDLMPAVPRLAGLFMGFAPETDPCPQGMKALFFDFKKDDAFRPGSMGRYMKRLGFSSEEVKNMKKDMKTNEDDDLETTLFQYPEPNVQFCIAYFWQLAKVKGDFLAAQELEAFIQNLAETMGGPKNEPVDEERRATATRALSQVAWNSLMAAEKEAIGNAAPEFADKIKEEATDRLLSFEEDLTRDEREVSQAVTYYSNPENIRKTVARIIGSRPGL